MSPYSRKKPCCHQCGSPMEGHRRPNGSPVCPTPPASPSPTPSRNASPRATSHPARSEPSPFKIPENATFFHRRNPNWVEPPPPRTAAPLQRHDTQLSLVATEIDDHVFVDLKNERTPQKPGARARATVEDEDDVVSVLSSQGSTTSRISRTLTEIMGGSRPLASMFSSPPKDVPSITRAAHKRGLFTGLVGGIGDGVHVKFEDPYASGPAEKLQDGRLVVMGPDPNAVKQLVEAGEKHLLSVALDAGSKPSVGAYPANPNSIRPTLLDIIIAGAVGGFVVLYGLSLL